MPHPFDERRVTPRADDRFVDVARLARVHRLARDELAVDRESKILKGGVRRQREQVVGFAERRAAVHETLFDLIAKHVVGELHAYVAAGSHDAGGTVAHDRRSAPFDGLNAQTARAWDDPSLRAECRRGESGGNDDCAANDVTADLTSD